MAGALQHLENAAHHLILAFDRLIRVGVGADRDGARLIIGRRQFLFQKRRRVGLHEQLGLEVEPRRQPQEGMRRPREAIDAAVLAAAIGLIERSNEMSGDSFRLMILRVSRPIPLSKTAAILRGSASRRRTRYGRSLRTGRRCSKAYRARAGVPARCRCRSADTARPEYCETALKMNVSWPLSNPFLRTKQERIPDAARNFVTFEPTWRFRTCSVSSQWIAPPGGQQCASFCVRRGYRRDPASSGLGARAYGDAPWCLNMPLGGGSVAERCDFRTFEACNADRILSNAFCVQNSRYLPYWQGRGFDKPTRSPQKAAPAVAVRPGRGRA